MTPPPARRRAFTLVEAIAAMVIVSLVAGLTWRLVASSATHAITASARAQLSHELSAALERVTLELRAIPRKAGVTPAAPNITSVTSQSVAWVNASGTAVTLSVVSGRLTLTDGSGGQTPLTNVTASLSVRVFDHVNNELSLPLSGASCDAVRRIELTVSTSRSGATETLRTRVFPRSLASG